MTFTPPPPTTVTPRRISGAAILGTTKMTRALLALLVTLAQFSVAATPQSSRGTPALQQLLLRAVVGFAARSFDAGNQNWRLPLSEEIVAGRARTYKNRL